jgi:predicted Rossmann fold nucleotide-binding protein DprA/Smf involved in DNA uptake
MLGHGSSDDRFDSRDSDTVVRILDSLSTTKPRTVEVIAAKSGMDVVSVGSGLGALLAEGRVVRHDDGWTSSLNGR